MTGGLFQRVPDLADSLKLVETVEAGPGGGAAGERGEACRRSDREACWAPSHSARCPSPLPLTVHLTAYVLSDRTSISLKNMIEQVLEGGDLRLRGGGAPVSIPLGRKRPAGASFTISKNRQERRKNKYDGRVTAMKR